MGYRFVAQTFQDKYWKIPSTDLGFIARYKINDFISVDAAMTNGEGPRVARDINGKGKKSFAYRIRRPILCRWE